MQPDVIESRQYKPVNDDVDDLGICIKIIFVEPACGEYF
jgi:hypothetical protein